MKTKHLSLFMLLLIFIYGCQNNLKIFDNNQNNESSPLSNANIVKSDSILFLFDHYKYFTKENSDEYSYIERFAKDGWKQFEDETGVKVMEYQGDRNIWLSDYPHRFKVAYSEIIAGTMPSIINFTKDDYPFYLMRDLILPLEIYPFYNDDIILTVENDELVYGYALRSGPTSLLTYYIDYITGSGLRDPLILWQEKNGIGIHGLEC